MKTVYISFIVSIFVLGALSCKKQNTTVPAPIVGKWHETKLVLSVDSSGITTHDTTYLNPFTSADYVEFNSDKTANISTDHYYYINGSGYPTTPQAIPPSVSAMKYSAAGTKYVLSPQSDLKNPGGFDVRDTVTLINSNTLLLHSVFYSHSPGYVSTTDSYYTK